MAEPKLTEAEQKYFATGGEADPAIPAAPVIDAAVIETADPAKAGVVDPAEKQQGQKTVPHEAMHEERERRKSAEKERDEERRNRLLLEERTNILLQRFGQPQAEQPRPKSDEIPAIDKDPLGFIVGTISKQQQELEVLKGSNNQQSQVQQQAQNIQLIQQTAVAQENEFRKETPDYDAAAQFLFNNRHAELAELGYDPQQRNLIVSQEMLGGAARALQLRKNPAAVVYAMAKARGYTATPAAPAAVQPAANAEAAAQIARVTAGQNQNQSLSSARGSGPQPLTAERLLKMTPSEFDKMVKTPEGRALMGV